MANPPAISATRFIENVVRFRLVYLALVVGVTLIFCFGLSRLETTRSHEIYFDDNAPELLSFEALQETFVKDENVLIVIKPKIGSVFRKDALTLVSTITEESWEIPYSFRVDSISNFQHSYADMEGIRVESLFVAERDLGRDSDTRIESIKRVALAQPSLRGRLINENGNVTAVNVHISLPGVDTVNETSEVVEGVRALVEKYKNRNPEIEFYLSGRIMMNNAFSEAAILDFKTLFPITLTIMIFGMAVCYRALLAGLIALLSIIASNLIMLGYAGFVGIHISPPTSTAPIIVMIISIANCVHLLHGYFAELENGYDQRKATLNSLISNLSPIFISTLTTVLCFCSLLISNVPPFRELGMLIVVGVTASFVICLIFFAVIFTKFGSKSLKSPMINSNLFRNLVFHIIKRKRALSVAAIVILTISCTGLLRNEMNDVFLHYFDPKIEFRQDSDFVVENLTGLYTLEYPLEVSDGGEITDPDFMRELDALVTWLRGIDSVRHVAVFTDTIKRLNQNFHDDDDSQYMLPTNKKEASQLLLLYELSLPYGLDLNDRINIAKTKTRVTIAIDTLSSVEVQKLETEINKWINSNTRKIATTGATGTTMMFANIGQNNIRSMIFSIAIALVFVSLALIVVFRSVALGLLSLIPNLFPAVIAFGVWGIFVGEVGLALSVVTSMTLGIIIDDTVHLLYSFKRNVSKCSEAGASIRASQMEVGPAVLTTSIAIISGFAFLSISSFEINASMGLMTAIVIFVALILDMIYLPLLLNRFYPRKLLRESAL